MPLWKANRNPDTFPASFHRALQGVGEIVIALEKSEKEAKLEQKRFSGFRFCLKNFPMHRSFAGFERFHTRTRVELDDVTGLWKVLVLTSEKLTNEGVWYEKS